MKIKSRLTLLVSFALASFTAIAQEAPFLQDVVVVYSTQQGLPSGKISSIHMDGNQPVAVASGKQYRWEGEQWAETFNKSKEGIRSSVVPPVGSEMQCLVRYNGGYAIGCDNGLFIREKDQQNWVLQLPADDNYSWVLSNVSALEVDDRGRLWFGSPQGVGCLSGNSWSLYTGAEGLPYNQFTCAESGKDGVMWFGTSKGAIRVDDGYFYYRFSRRWLPDDHVNAIAVAQDGTAWIATNGGVSQISPLQMTFDEKARHFTEQVEMRHNRMGFVCQSHLEKQFDITTSELAISDNDGLYTAMYGAAQAFRYAVTGQREARALAVRSFYACKWLVDITHEPGFPARVIIPVDWHEPVNEQYSREYNKRAQQKDPFWKDIYPRFPLSKDGNYRWKCDTSSDELAGHYFFYAIFYDLIAETEQEKADVRQVVADITDHLIRHGFCLVDHDGKPTRWANFQPEFFNSVWGWEQRGLNSMMMLSFLNVASHVTGNPKYEETAKMLRDKHQYHINAMHAKEYFPPGNVVPWDNNLCLMSMYGLLKYEQDPELLLMYRQSLEIAWLHISKQNNAFWDTLYGALAAHFTELVEKHYFDSDTIFAENPLYKPRVIEELRESRLDNDFIIETLKRIPMDLIGYTMDNTHRLDVLFDPTPGQEPTIGWRTDGYALPIDERGHVRQDRDGFALSYSEGNGFSEHEGTFFLLPYYMARYHNLIR